MAGKRVSSTVTHTNERNETGRTNIMKKTLIAAAALASLAAGMAATASTAEAKIHVNLNVGLLGGGYGYGGGFYDPGYYYDDTPDCGWEYGPVVKWKHHHKVIVYGKHWVCY
jgi:hypothetical protein